MPEDFDIVFESEDDEVDFDIVFTPDIPTEPRCPECDGPLQSNFCSTCSLAWFIPTPKEPLH